MSWTLPASQPATDLVRELLGLHQEVAQVVLERAKVRLCLHQALDEVGDLLGGREGRPSEEQCSEKTGEPTGTAESRDLAADEQFLH